MIGLTAILETQRQKICSDVKRQSKAYKERNRERGYCREGSREKGECSSKMLNISLHIIVTIHNIQ